MPAPQSKKLSSNTFAPGARVVVRDEDWIVRIAEQSSTGATAVHVTGLSELVRGKDAIFLDDLDKIIELRPEETSLVSDPSPHYRRSKLFLESLLRQSPPTEDALCIGHLAAIDPAPYQLVPAHKALAQPRPRILIADGVGLGKTIETGILMSELIRRGRGRRILVVALKSILEQFQEELWVRFTIPLVRLDSAGIQRVQRKIPANMNPFHIFNRVIISIDTLKKDQKYSRFLEQCHWDITVIDECQHVAIRARPGNSGKSQRARLAELLARRCDSLILTSATPHDGRPESFASLMNLLDPTAVANPYEYLPEEIRGLYVRRFKKDIAHEVSQAFQERSVKMHYIDAFPTEDTVFEKLSTAEFKTIQVRTAAKGVLFRTLLLKGFLSSPEALLQTVEERLKHKDLQKLDEGQGLHDRTLLTDIRRVAKAVPEGHSSKLSALVALLHKMGIGAKGTDERVVIFSERIKTLEMLRDQLQNLAGLPKEAIAVFHGTLDDESQQDMVKDFGTASSKVRVLLASDAASEGINLHYFCHRLIHFDIPWSLITLEQRNGRIDRYGQARQPEVHYLVTRPSNSKIRGDIRILDVLIEKEDKAHDNLGDVKWLMKLHDAEAEEERIQVAISLGEDPDQVIADPDEILGNDFLADLIAAEQAEDKAVKNQPHTESQLSLFNDSASFLKEAFSELVEADDSIQPPEWHDHLKGFSITAPEDLQRRFSHLPPELRNDASWVFKLTADRKLVQEGLGKSREDHGRWPEWQLLWDLHPISEWINDRLVAHFGRHEAPVLRVSKGLGKNQCAFLMQGIISNQQSQPVIVDWFGLVFDSSSADPELFALRDLVKRVALDSALSNDGLSVEVEPFEPLRVKAVAVGDAHMKALRIARAKSLLPLLKEQKERLKLWEEKSLGQIEDKRKSAGYSIRKDQAQRLTEREATIADTMHKRMKWVDNRLSTSDQPYLRIAAVFAGTPAKGAKG